MTAEDTTTGMRAFGVLEVVHDSAPTHSAYLASDTARSQSSADAGVNGRAYFWVCSTTSTATTTTSSRRNLIQRRASAQWQTVGTGTGKGRRAHANRRVSGPGAPHAGEATQGHNSAPASQAGTRSTSVRDTTTTTTTEYYSVDFLVVHAAPWFESGAMVQAIALHRTDSGSDALQPRRPIVLQCRFLQHHQRRRRDGAELQRVDHGRPAP